MASPPIAPERLRHVLDCLASGMNPYATARVTGVSATYIYTLHHSLGGVYRPLQSEYSDRYLSREDRYEIARLRDAGCSMREIGRRIGFDVSAVSRELQRNVDPKTGRYHPEKAHRLAWERQRRPKQSKLTRLPELREQVQAHLDRRRSPEQ